MRVSRRSARPTVAADAGTKEPTCARYTISATWGAESGGWERGWVGWQAEGVYVAWGTMEGGTRGSKKLCSAHVRVRLQGARGPMPVAQAHRPGRRATRLLGVAAFAAGVGPRNHVQPRARRGHERVIGHKAAGALCNQLRQWMAPWVGRQRVVGLSGPVYVRGVHTAVGRRLAPRGGREGSKLKGLGACAVAIRKRLAPRLPPNSSVDVLASPQTHLGVRPAPARPPGWACSTRCRGQRPQATAGSPARRQQRTRP